MFALHFIMQTTMYDGAEEPRLIIENRDQVKG